MDNLIKDTEVEKNYQKLAWKNFKLSSETSSKEIGLF